MVSYDHGWENELFCFDFSGERRVRGDEGGDLFCLMLVLSPIDDKYEKGKYDINQNINSLPIHYTNHIREK